MLNINAKRMIARINALGCLGIDAEGHRTRTTATDEDKAGRDLVTGWMRDAGLRVEIDRFGNIYGIWETEANKNEKPFIMGSHIDTVKDAGQYDGCLGVIAGLEVVETMKESGLETKRPVGVCIFTNEEGIRFSPAMMGSLIIAGGVSCDEALASVGEDGSILGEELERIGYAGSIEPGSIIPSAFVELHIEQGPVLDAEGIKLGVVEDLQGLCQYEIEITGEQNHAGTTPTAYRADAGLAAAKVNVFMRERCLMPGSRTVATVGFLKLHPGAPNVIPSKATFIVDARCPSDKALQADIDAMLDYLKELERTDGVKTQAKCLHQFDSVVFDEHIVDVIEKHARASGLSWKRMTSGAGQDAQMMARICPTAMIFVPSVKGISHSPLEYTKDEDLAAGAALLLSVAEELSGLK